ncbi:MAG: WHG domain-containing protein [Pseudonocardiales bacterium]|nr:WHG domain-containing protein [Pseudonocardiales bacterium]MBV9730209.1 WHG domain-containing protein [Pseudonocardiales bacterium]
MARPKLHNDALRIRLLDTAGSLLTSEGPDALSLRRLAAAAGTSTSAVYALFGGKPGILRALFVEAFTRFGAHLDTVRPSDDPLADILALGRAYRASATADPHLYMVMFGSPVPGFEPAPQDWAQAEATFTPLLDAVRRAVVAGLLIDANPGLIATALWANVHGLVSLELGAAIPPQAGAPATVFEAAIRATLDGWRVRP